MAFINLEGEREATTQKSEEYGKKVIELLGLKGYFLEYDSNIEGVFQDKIFRNPKVDGNKKTVVEIKDTKLSLTDLNFLVEYGKYCLLYSKEEFNLIIFAADVSNARKWKQIFELTKQSETELKSFYTKVCGTLKEQSLNFEKFCSFVNSTDVWKTSYIKLLQTIEQIKADNIYDSKADYLDDTEKIVYETEKLDSNIFLVDSYPQFLFKAKLKAKSKFNNFWKQPFADSFVQYNGILYSVEEIPEDVLSEYCEVNSYGSFKFSNIDIVQENKLVSQLIRSQIILSAFQKGFYYDRKRKALYNPHRNLNQDEIKVKVKDEKLRYLSKVYRRADGSVNFVSHRSIKFDVIELNGKFYAIFDNFRLFSTNGKRLIKGENAKKLNYKFAPIKAFNDNEKSKLFFLLKAIGLPEWTKHSQSNLFNFDHFSKNQFSFKEMLFEIDCKAQIGEVFNENFDYEDNFYSQITDYEE